MTEMVVVIGMSFVVGLAIGMMLPEPSSRPWRLAPEVSDRVQDRALTAVLALDAVSRELVEAGEMAKARLVQEEMARVIGWAKREDEIL